MDRFLVISKMMPPIILILLLLINNISAEYCGRIHYSGNSGTISKYSVNASYSACTYTISAPPSRRLKLTWRKFKVNSDMPSCYGTTVTVRVGCKRSKTVAKFCSRNMDSLPHDVYSSDGCMEIWYLRKGVGGFIAQYSTYDVNDVVTNRCEDDRVIKHLPVTITSPGWPLRIYDSSCKWKIQLASRYKRMVVNIMDLNGFSYGNYGCHLSEYLEVEGLKSISTKNTRSWYFCKSNQGSSLNDAQSKALKYSEIALTFKSRYINDGRRGFVIGIVAYDVPVLTMWTSIASGVGAIILIIIVFTVILRRCRYRRYLQQQQQQGQVMLSTSTTEPVLDPTPPTQTYYPAPNINIPSAYPAQQPVPYDQVPFQPPPPYHPPSYNEAVSGTVVTYPPYVPSESSEASSVPYPPR